MAQFSISYRKTSGHEGGYADNLNDRGGETYRGIARKRHPDWEGWQIVDRLKLESDFPKNLETDPDISNLVVKFYHDNFWTAINGDVIQQQEIADELYDTGVNMGVVAAIKILQNSLNILNKNQTLYKDISEDGKIGQQTLGAISAFLATRKLEFLLKVVNVAQGCRYLQLLQDPSQELFAVGWMNRITIEKN